jgi:hypothetical protein
VPSVEVVSSFEGIASLLWTMVHTFSLNQIKFPVDMWSSSS